MCMPDKDGTQEVLVGYGDRVVRLFRWYEEWRDDEADYETPK